MAKQPVMCVVCGTDTALNGGKKKIQGGHICFRCFLAAGYSPGMIAIADTVDSIRAKQASCAEQYRLSQVFSETDNIAGMIHLDRNNSLWYYEEPRAFGQPIIHWIYRFDQANGCAIYEDNEVVITTKKSGVGRAIVGGALFGGVGAIVGASTGGAKSVAKPMVNLLYIQVFNNDPVQNDICIFRGLKIVLISSATATSNIVYQRLRMAADEIVRAFDSMIPEEPPVDDTIATLSAADEIRKFKALLDDGVITQEEFDSKKKQLLGV